jgi:flagellar protein FlaG
MMEINNTAQLVNISNANKIESVVTSASNQSIAEQNKLGDSLLTKSVNQSELVPEVTELESNDQQLQQVAKDLTDMVAMMQKGLKFSVDDDSGKQVIKVQDIESGDIIRQIPSEEALELAKKISEVSGVLMPIEV